MTINVHIGDGVRLNMGTQSFTKYLADDTPASLDVSFLGIVRVFATGGTTFVDGDPLLMSSGGYDLEIYGETDGTLDPVEFTTFTVDGFDLTDDADAEIVSMDFNFGLDLVEMVNLVFDDPGSADGVVADFAELLAGVGAYMQDGEKGSRLNGTAQADTLSGNHGRDDLYGLGGDDEVYGGADGDRLDGGAGDDLLNAGGGADWLAGGTGRDTLVGGIGADTFYFRLPLAAGSADTIVDFRPGADHLLFDNMPLVIGATVETSEFRSGKNISVAGGATTPDQHFLYDKDSGRLFYDADGSATGSSPVLVAVLTGNPVLTAADITIVF